jgi:hypothetical protein
VQVATLGQEEKRAFTSVPSISAAGVMLPTQAVFAGKSPNSLPRAGSRGFEEAVKLGFKLVFSMNASYWSTQLTMQSLVKDIIAPYFDQMIAELGLDPTQYCLWKIDCWSVHRSAEFLGWMAENYPRILIVFVPGGCTGLFQPLDVGIQRVYKQSMRQSAHRDVVAEATALFASLTDDENDTGTISEPDHNDAETIESVEPLLLKLDTTLPTHRNRCVGWIVDAFHGCNDKELILKVRPPILSNIDSHLLEPI